MTCEESVVLVKLHWHSYLVFSLGNCVPETLAMFGWMEVLVLVCSKLTPKLTLWS
jgi:hypothetical protein